MISAAELRRAATPLTLIFSFPPSLSKQGSGQNNKVAGFRSLMFTSSTALYRTDNELADLNFSFRICGVRIDPWNQTSVAARSSSSRYSLFICLLGPE